MPSLPSKKPSRLVIEDLAPSVAGEGFYVKRVLGEATSVQAAVYSDGHHKISARLLWREKGTEIWNVQAMKLLGNDLFGAEFFGPRVGFYEYTVEGWMDEYGTFVSDLVKKKEALQDLAVEYKIGSAFLKRAIERAKPEDKVFLKSFFEEIQKKDDPFSLFMDMKLAEVLQNSLTPENYTLADRTVLVRYQRKKALFSAWYELFPRSFGGFKGVAERMSMIAEMGFDTLYLPPIHPIGKTNRKGKDNNPKAQPQDPGSPWAIGSQEGGHDFLSPSLGSDQEFQRLLKEAEKFGIEIALDFALQCSPDHPYITEHPEWFKWRPDKTIQYAENPPKKYEDIVPLNFDTEDWKSLWEEILRVIIFWVRRGGRIFRVDNPHTKPFAFWKWLIEEVHKIDAEVIFLSEAFTRPHVMQRLAKMGFDQSYTYFTWRNTKDELTQYMNELIASPLRDYFRPNFWPNTPDILPECLQYGGRPAFIARLVLAATLSSNYGIYGPPFELCIKDAISGKEEYLHSEKYEVRKWNREKKKPLDEITEIITLVNQLRKQHPAFQTTWNLSFCEISNNFMIAYVKENFLMVVNLDPFNIQSGNLHLPLELLGIQEDQQFLVYDHLSDKKYMWNGRVQHVEINPNKCPACIFKIHSKARKEHNFDYYL